MLKDNFFFYQTTNMKLNKKIKKTIQNIMKQKLYSQFLLLKINYFHKFHQLAKPPKTLYSIIIFSFNNEISKMSIYSINLMSPLTISQ